MGKAVFGFSLGVHPIPAPSPLFVNLRATPLVPPQWETFYVGGAASIAMPVQPEERLESLDARGARLLRHLLKAEINQGAQSLELSYVDARFDQLPGFHGAPAQDVLRPIVNAILEKMGGEVTASHDLTFGSFPAMAFTAESLGDTKLGHAELWGRAYLIHNRVYVNLAAARKGTLKPEQAEGFLESFKNLDD